MLALKIEKCRTVKEGMFTLENNYNLYNARATRSHSI